MPVRVHFYNVTFEKIKKCQVRETINKNVLSNILAINNSCTKTLPNFSTHEVSVFLRMFFGRKTLEPQKGSVSALCFCKISGGTQPWKIVL